jgi:predicted dehydrogenase
MSQEDIRVGIVGADTKASWAKVSHVPAIKDLPGVRLAAVATRSERSAREAAEAFAADRWYSDPFAMIRDDRIDIVTIAVKVPAHRELVLMALAAGKRRWRARCVRTTRRSGCRAGTIRPCDARPSWFPREGSGVH